ncbi:MAG: asparagine synthetase B [Gemmatimonadetes bacterium]|nr:asparagine synthetase B [Gemmatimonadota bacterium]
MILKRQNAKFTLFTLLVLLFILTTPFISPAAIGGGSANVGKILISMDVSQTDHLKAYGIAYWAVQQGHPVEWLLNYRGGSFLIDHHETIAREARIRAVSFQAISAAQATRIYADIESGNMNRMRLEKAPRIAVYTPPNKQPWDDAVTLALTYAEIPYTTLWDEEVLSGKLENFDWLHLHHEDFTGQYGKFYLSHGHTLWYRQQQAGFKALAGKLGFAKVAHLKGAVAQAIYNYVAQGGFLFAMCSATDTFDIALAARGIDIVDSVYDGDPADPMARQKLDFSRTVAFENFNLVMDPLEYEHADIDLSPIEMSQVKNADIDAFSLFEFSAKYDPVPTMLTQNHTPVVPGFLGQTTAFRKNRIKKSVTIMGDIPGTDHVKYIHGNIGKGTFTFYAGHDPEDYQHFVNDPPTQLALHKNSPGYRLILNNILFPAAKKEKRKT